MTLIYLASETDFEGWREHARALCLKGVEPHYVEWRTPSEGKSLFDRDMSDDRLLPRLMPFPSVRVPKAFLELGRRVSCHVDRSRFHRLYRLLWRLQTTKHLLDNVMDDDVAWLNACEKNIRRDIHKMHAFVRFRKAGETPDGRECFAAWFEPSYRIVELATPFFQRRFANMNWVIVTPEASAHWDGEALTFGPGGSKDDVPSEDSLEDGWKTYFRSIFNPSRVKISAMTSEMPKKYWKNLPEAALIPELLQSAEKRSREMVANSVTEEHPLAARLDARKSSVAISQDEEGARTLEDLSQLAAGCEKCPLYQDASQTVFGEGRADARLMIVGEQPGDQEDIAGAPFVGPAGQLLDECLSAADIARDEAYVTNAVKHFKFELRGKRRIHQSPRVSEIDHCRWWLNEERRLVQPDLIIALGASAARSVLGRSVRIADVRGEILSTGDGARVLVTVHPSFLLRLQDRQAQQREVARFVEDLRLAQSHLNVSC